MRRQFELPEEDSMYLNASEISWETIVEGGAKWLLLHTIDLPEGYNEKNASIAFRLDAGYPMTQIDMAYFYPAIARIDKKVIGALASCSIDGKVWQRWSRHRTGANPWRPGLDDVSTHLELVKTWLQKEFEKR